MSLKVGDRVRLDKDVLLASPDSTYDEGTNMCTVQGSNYVFHLNMGCVQEAFACPEHIITELNDARRIARLSTPDGQDEGYYGLPAIVLCTND